MVMALAVIVVAVIIVAVMVVCGNGCETCNGGDGGRCGCCDRGGGYSRGDFGADEGNGGGVGPYE